MSLRDLDELVQSCREEEAKRYIAEAVMCYRAGAYRACVVASWIAVVFDLIAKFRELALSGDAEAQKITADLASWQPLIEKGDTAMIRKSLELEREIVNIANDRFGFFDGIQVLDLTRLRDDRNRCAHPTFQGGELPYLPSPELARTHLVHAVQHVLSQPPVQGKAATAHIIKIVSSSFFPTDLEAAKNQLRSAGLERPKDALVRSVVDQLIFGILEGGSELKARRQTAIALKAVHELHPGQAEPRIKRALNLICRRISDSDLSLIIILHQYLRQTWDFLESDNKQKLAEFVKMVSDVQVRSVLPVAVEIVGLEDACRIRISKLPVRELGEVLKFHQSPVLIERAVDFYCGSKNWEQANLNYEMAIEPILGKLDQAHIRRILAAPKAERADLNGSHSFSGFTRYVYEKEKLPKVETLKILTENDMDYIAARLQIDDDIPF